MSSELEASGDIEIFCYPSMGSPTIGVRYFGDVTAGDRLSLVFGPGDSASPPYALKIFSPTGANILDTIVRSLPTGTPQSPPPIEFVVSARGIYKIQIRELKGRQSGEAQLKVS
jgi:hypothetical protein